MIGLTLVVSMGVFASSLKASFGDVLGDRVDADLYVVGASAQAAGYGPSVVDEVARVDGVDQVSALRTEAAPAGSTGTSSSVASSSNSDRERGIRSSPPRAWTAESTRLQARS